MNQQKSAVAWVKSVGGTVQYDYEWNDAAWIPDAELPGPDWLCQLIGVDFFASVAEVSLTDGVIDDLSPLYQLKKLRMLILWEPLAQVPDEEMSAV